MGKNEESIELPHGMELDRYTGVISGQPDMVRVSLENGTELADRTIIGPFSQGQKVVLRSELSQGGEKKGQGHAGAEQGQ